MTLRKVEAATTAHCEFKTLKWSWLNQEYELQTCELDIEEVNDDEFKLSTSMTNELTGLKIEFKKGLKFLPVNLASVMSNLMAIEIFECSVESIKREHFRGLSKLRYLNLGYNKITNVAGDAFADLTSLEILELDFNFIEHFDEKSFAGLRALKQLQLEGNKMRTLHPKIFESLVNVEEIRLDSNKINNIDENIFKSLAYLTLINCYDNELTKIPRNLFRNNNKLEGILLGSNFIEVIDENAFLYLPKLKIVDLSENLCVNRKYTKGFNLLRKDLKQKCSKNSSLDKLDTAVQDLKTILNDKMRSFDINNMTLRKLETAVKDLEMKFNNDTKKIEASQKEIGALKQDILQTVNDKYELLHSRFDADNKTSYAPSQLVSINRHVVWLVFIFCVALFFVVLILVIIYPPTRVLRHW